jgi:hypothetical protein
LYTAFEVKRFISAPALAIVRHSSVHGHAQRSATQIMKQTTTKTKATTKAAKTTTSKAAKATTKPTGRATKPAAAPKAAKVAKDATAPKTSRRDAIVALISRPTGATLPEIMEATGWQRHSVRGMISILGKTLTIGSSKNDAGERTYIAAQPKAAKVKAAKPAPAAAA